jgi:hypothetical protein
MELLQRYSGIEQHMTAEPFGALDQGLVSRDRRAIREKIETEPKMPKCFSIAPGQARSQDLTLAGSVKSGFTDPT